MQWVKDRLLEEGENNKNATIFSKGLSIMKQNKITFELGFCRNICIKVVSGRQMIH